MSDLPSPVSAAVLSDKPRILIVDDERFNLNTLHGLLKEDHKIMVAMGGEQALKAAIAGRPDRSASSIDASPYSVPAMSSGRILP